MAQDKAELILEKLRNFAGMEFLNLLVSVVKHQVK